SHWDVAADDECTASDLLLLTQLYHGHSLDRFGGLTPLAPVELCSRWEKLRAKHPAEFTVPPAQALAWRLAEITACAREENWSGAWLHLYWLLTEADSDIRPAVRQ